MLFTSSRTRNPLSLAKVSTTTTPYTATSADDVILIDATAGAKTVNLPAAAGASEKVYIIKKTDSSFNAVTIDPNASETIDGSTTTTINTQFESITIQSDGTNWQLLERRIPSEWVSYIPTIGGAGTVTSLTTFYRRVGDSIEIQGRFTAGNVALSAANFTLPTGLAYDSSKMAGTGTFIVGNWTRATAGAQFGTSLINTSVAPIQFGAAEAGFGGLVARDGNSCWANSDSIAFNAKVPISGWKG